VLSLFREPALSETGRDQADGLRRMFRRPPTPVIAFAGGRSGSGATRVACAFAQGLAARGVSVSLVDEHRGEAGAAALLNAQGRFDLWQVINGDALMMQAVVRAGAGLRVVPAARLAQQRDGLRAEQQVQFDQCWGAVCDGGEVVVIDALVGTGGRLSPLAAKAGSLVVVTAVDSAAVMGAYLALKQIVLSHPRLALSLVINRARDAGQAAAVADNMRALMLDQLGRQLQCYSWLPRIPAWRRGGAGQAAMQGPVADLEALLALLPDELRFRSRGDEGLTNPNLPGGARQTQVAAARAALRP